MALAVLAMVSIIALLLVALTTHTAIPATVSLDDLAKQYLSARNDRYLPMLQASVEAEWNYAANLTEENRIAQENVQLQQVKLSKLLWNEFEAQGWPVKLKGVNDDSLRRQLKAILRSGSSSLSEAEAAESMHQLLPEQKNSLLSSMSSVYSKAQVNLCVTIKEQNCTLNLEPELTTLLTENRDYQVLQTAWTDWREVSGKKVRQDYIRYVELANKEARQNNFSDLAESKISVYETENFREEIERLYNELLPLYKQLHAYVRRKLREKYGEDKIGEKSPIPAHLLGNMWAQTWNNIEDITAPFPEKQVIDVTDAMKEQGYTPLKMFQLSDKFFRDLNLTRMTDKFWKLSIIEKPENTEMVCHASAWSFYHSDDFRIKMCTDVTMEKLGTIHHEMGHVEYYLQYDEQPLAFQEGANPGFHEAVGDTLALSVLTPKHLYNIGLLDSVTDDKEADLNFLMSKALGKIAFLPYGYLIDSYRWDVFSGNISYDDLNCEWWQKRYEIQGIYPPVQRTEEDFDPGAKFHVVADVPYIRYFVSYVIQFQMHKALCLKAGQYDPNDPAKPLYKCDIDQSTEAGNALADMLKLGSSRPWQEALAQLTGSKKMDVSVLREYFDPLEKWLIRDNNEHGEFIGWEKDGDYCSN